MVALGAIEGGDIADRDVVDLGNVEHRDVHGDDADEGCFLASDIDTAAIAKGAMDAVAVTGRQYRHERRTLGHPAGVVADARAGGDRANIEKSRAQAHHRAESERGFVFGTQIERIKARMVAVEDRTGPDHVGPGFGAGGNRSAVGDMNDARGDAECPEAVRGGEKTVELRG